METRRHTGIRKGQCVGWHHQVGHKAFCLPSPSLLPRGQSLQGVDVIPCISFGGRFCGYWWIGRAVQVQDQDQLLVAHLRHPTLHLHLLDNPFQFRITRDLLRLLLPLLLPGHPQTTQTTPTTTARLSFPTLQTYREMDDCPGLEVVSGSYQPHPHTHMVTTISALRSADNEAAPKKGMARVWSNKGKRRGKTEDKPTSEEASVECAPSAADHRSDTWARSHNEGLDRLRHMSSSGRRQSGSKGGLLKSFRSRDR
jgi:hypothetical protein